MTDNKVGLVSAAVFFMILLLVANCVHINGERMNKADAIISSADGSQAIVKNVPIIVNSDRTLRIGTVVTDSTTSYVLQDDVMYIKTENFDGIVESLIQEGYEVDDYEDIHE